MKKRIFFLLCGVLFLLGGCGKSANVEQKEGNQYKDHDFIQKEIADKIKVEAELSFPECEDYYVMDAALWYPDAEDVIKELFDEQEYELITEGQFSEYNDTGYRIQGAEDCTMWGTYGGTLYISFQKDKPITYGNILSSLLDENAFYESYPLYIKETMDIFSEDGIDGFKVERCEKKVNRLMEQMGINGYYDGNPQVVAMDKNNMEKVKEAAKLVEEDEVPDEGYFFLYNRELYGLPLYDLSYPSNVGGAQTAGCACTVEVYKNGDIEMEATGMYEIGERERVDIIQPEEVLDILEKKYGEIISETDIAIDEILLRYLPVQLKSGEPEFTVRPAWILRTWEGMIFGEEESGRIGYSAIDAVSGEWVF